MGIKRMRCESCLYWAFADDVRKNMAIGECRIMPPAIDDSPGLIRPRGIWPSTLSHEFCGEWQPKTTNDPASDCP